MDLQDLIDRESIRDVLLRYSRGADRRDEGLLRSVYHPEAVDNHGTFKGPASEFVDHMMASGAGAFRSGQHLLGNIAIELDGDVASVESVFICHLVSDNEPETIVLGGRYWDRFERRDGHWKIVDRTVLLDWSETHVAMPVAAVAASFVQGIRGRGDLSYGAGGTSLT